MTRGRSYYWETRQNQEPDVGTVCGLTDDIGVEQRNISVQPVYMGLPNISVWVLHSDEMKRVESLYGNPRSTLS